MEEIRKNIDYYYSNLKELDYFDTEELKAMVNISTSVLSGKSYDNLFKVKAYKVTSYIAMLDKIPIEERWVLYWLLKSNEFVMTIFDDLEKDMDKLYETIVFDIERQMPKSLLKSKDENEKKDGPIVIITNQFLGRRHAPTRRILDYAYTIQKILGIQVVIINAAELNMENYSYICVTRKFNYIKKYEQNKKIKYKEVDFAFYQTKEKMINLSEIEKMLDKVKKLNPCLVLNVGDCCVTADLCRNFVKTATIPCATSIPRSMAEYLILCRNVRESDQERISRLQPWQHIVESKFNYIMSNEITTKCYKRSHFGISEKEWLLLVAGNRMEEELDDEFLNMVDDVLEKIEGSCFLVIGEIKNKEKVLKKINNKEKVFLVGYLDDASQAIRLADVYIQPKRKGGGRAAFEAMWYGVPVITTKYGDVWDVCGDNFGVDSYEEMKTEIISCYYEKEDYEKKKQLSRNRAIELEDMKGTFQKLFEDIGIY